MMKVFVPGGLGYVGCQLVNRLLQEPDVSVHVTDVLMWNQEQVLGGFMGHPRFSFDMVDVRDEDRMTPLLDWADVVIPLAAIVGQPACARNEGFAYSINRDSIRWMISKLSKNQRVIFPQTNSGYGTTDGQTPCTEETPLKPISAYALGKGEAEEAVLSHPNSVSLRLATVFGCSPRMRFDLLVNDWTARIFMDGTIAIYEPEAVRNFVHVRDVAEAFVFFCGTNYTGAFNCGLPEANLTKLGLAHRICDTLSLSREMVKVGQGTDPDKRNYLVSNKKLLDSGFKFNRTLEEGIMEVAGYARFLTPPARAKMRNA